MIEYFNKSLSEKYYLPNVHQFFVLILINTNMIVLIKLTHCKKIEVKSNNFIQIYINNFQTEISRKNVIHYATITTCTPTMSNLYRKHKTTNPIFHG